jgi:hypothetical protein
MTSQHTPKCINRYTTCTTSAATPPPVLASTFRFLAESYSTLTASSRLKSPSLQQPPKLMTQNRLSSLSKYSLISTLTSENSTSSPKFATWILQHTLKAVESNIAPSVPSSRIAKPHVPEDHPPHTPDAVSLLRVLPLPTTTLTHSFPIFSTPCPT